MRKIDVRSSFKQDYKNVKKQNWDTEKINKVITELQISEVLRPELKDHALIGGFKGFRECHIYADLVVIYKRDDKMLTLYRIGRHQDLFKKY